MSSFTRRTMIGAMTSAALGPTLWAAMLSGGRTLSAAPLSDDLLPPDAQGIRLRPGFSSRLLAETGRVVGSSGFVWHIAPDGGATIPRPDLSEGWSYVSNSEASAGGGGASALDFDRFGELVNARSILAGTDRNCAGGQTPWRTWLSCEEVDRGRVLEVDPFGPTVPTADSVRPMLGRFRHEAAAVDPTTGIVYLTEDERNGRLYRFVPSEIGQLRRGHLEAARVSVDPSSITRPATATVAWQPTSVDGPDRDPATSAFDGGEGAWISGDRLLFTTKGDNRVWSLGLRTNELSILHDGVATPQTPLHGVDNLTVHPFSGAVFVAEDLDDMQLCSINDVGDGQLETRVELQIVGHEGSEVTGPAFSPDGTRLYLSSQRGVGVAGRTYEISGPFARPLLTPATGDGLRPARRLGSG